VGRMKLKGEEYIPVKSAFEAVLDWDKEKREKTGSSWFVRKENEEYVDRRPKVEELYEYLKGLPERSWRSRKATAEEDWKVELYDRYIEEGDIPKEMTVKITDDNHLPLETTLCAFVTFHSFKREEANEIVKNVLDRLNLHERRSFGRKYELGKQRELAKEIDTDDEENWKNPIPDKRDPQYHRDSDEPDFIELEKVGKSEQELKRKIPPRLSDQQKFILARLSQEGTGDVPERYFDWITSLSYDVAEEFGSGHKDRVFDREVQHQINKQESSSGAKTAAKITGLLLEDTKSQNKVLTRKHRASFSRSLKKLKERGLIRTVVDKNRKNVVLTEKGLQAAFEIKRRLEDGRYSLEFETL